MLVGVLDLLVITMVFLKIRGYSNEKYKNLEHPSNQIIRNQVKQYSYHKGY